MDNGEEGGSRGAILDFVPLPLVVLDADLRVTEWSAAAEGLFGWPAAAIIGRAPAELPFLAEEDRAAFAAALGQVGQGDAPSCGLFRSHCHTHSGQALWVEWRAAPLPDAQEDRPHLVLVALGPAAAPRGVEGSGGDEPIRQLTEANLTDVLYRYRLLPDPAYEYVSPSISEITGYSPEEHYADPLLIRKLVYPEDLPILDSSLSGSLPDTPVTFVLRWVSKEGQVLWMEHRIRCFHDDRNRLVAVEGIARDVTDQKQLEAERDALLARQTRIAEELQRALLLLPAPDAFPDIAVEAVYEPASDDTLIGGDFYDVFSLDETHVALVVGDVAGKGLAAAVYTAEVKFALRVFLRERPDPAEALSRLNRFILDGQRFDRTSQAGQTGQGGIYVSAIAAVLETTTGRLACSVAGTEPPFILHNGDDDEPVTVLSASGPLLGMVAAGEFAAVEATIAPDDLLFVFTDGLVEARRDGTVLGYDGLVAAARACAADDGSGTGIGRGIVDLARAYSGGLRQDDVCLLVVRRLRPGEQRSAPLPAANAASGVEVQPAPPWGASPQGAAGPPRSFHEALRALHEAVIVLSRAETVEDLCRAAVELGRERLGFDRISLWVSGDDPDLLVGTFGTDENGATRDERAQAVRSLRWSRRESFDGRAVSVYPDWPLADERHNLVGRGWMVTAALRDGDEVVGQLYADNLLRRRPLLDYQPELLGLYGAAVGHLYCRLRTELARRASEARYAGVVESAMDAILCVDAALRITVFNPAAERMFGHSAEEVIGRPLSLLLLEHLDRLLHTEAARADRRSGVGKMPVEYIKELTARRREGSEFPVEAAFSRVGPPGEVQYTAVVRDITERKRTEQTITEAEARQRSFLRDVLYAVTEGRLRLVDTLEELPAPLPLAGEAMPLTLPALRQIRDQVRDAALAQGLSEASAFDLVTAAGEAMINAVQHGSGETATARIHAASGRVQVWVEDRGSGIPVSDLPKATLLKGHSGGGSFGHGFFMMLSTADVVYLLTGPSGTTVVLEQFATPPTPPWLTGI